MDLRLKNPLQLGLAGLFLLAVAWFGLAGPGTPILFYLALTVLVVAGITWAIKPQRRTAYWRGREIDLSGSLTWWERLYYRIYRE